MDARQARRPVVTHDVELHGCPPARALAAALAVLAPLAGVALWRLDGLPSWERVLGTGLAAWFAVALGAVALRGCVRARTATLRHVESDPAPCQAPYRTP